MSGEFRLDHRFDPGTKKHYLNDELSVLHCHHYSTLFTKLAMDLDGVEHLVETGEDVFGRVLRQYFLDKAVSSVGERIGIAQQYWQAVGMGLIEISSSDASGGAAKMEYSHLDEGWLKKWGGSDKPVNIITRGFLAGVFAAVYDKPPRSYYVEETKSLARGDKAGEFTITLR